MTEQMRQQARVTTIRDVAERAGVSKSLVSLVVRGAPHVSESRRLAVLEAMAALDYRPNRAARELSTARSDTVGILLNDLRNPWFVDLLEGLTATLHGADLASILADSHTDRRIGRPSVETLMSQGIDGLVVVGTTSEAAALAAASAAVPVILAGTREPQLPHADVVVDDDELGGRLATEHLIALGHRRIAHLRGPGNVGEFRYAGYETAMLRAGLDPRTYTETTGMTEESGYSAARRLLSRSDQPTAIFSFNDITAVGAMSAAADAGVTVPHQLSLVGYDNTYLARIRHISLTSVDNGNFAVGVQSGKFLIERLSNPTLGARSHIVPTSLHVRGSTGPAPATTETHRK